MEPLKSPTVNKSNNPSFTIRPARPDDLGDIVRMIHEMASFEQLTADCDISAERVREHLFGARPMVECLIAEMGTERVGHAIFFHNYSTFLTRPGIYLEDLYVSVNHRRHGIGRALLQAIYDLAAERKCGRVEWLVLDWNESAIKFYTEAMQATPVKGWTLMRVTQNRFRTPS